MVGRVTAGRTLARPRTFDQLADEPQTWWGNRPFGKVKGNGYLAALMRQTAWLTLVGALVLGLWERAAMGACSASSAPAGLGCFDAEPTTGPAEPSAFRWMAEGTVLGQGGLALGLHFHYSHAPLELVAPSAMPSGRTIPIVRYSSRLEMRAAVGIHRLMDLTLAMPYTVDQEGSGSEALSSQRPTPIARSGLSDMRLGFRVATPMLEPTLSGNLRLEMTLPTGAAASYLGDESATQTVALNLAKSSGAWLFATDVGIRFRKTRTFSDIAIGTHPFFALGVAFRILEKERLTASTEFLIRPMLAAQPTLQSGTSIDANTHASWVAPAEWMLNASSRPTKLPLWVSIGAGTALPLSSRDSSESHVAGAFFAPTAPRARVSTSVTLRY